MIHLIVLVLHTFFIVLVLLSVGFSLSALSLMSMNINQTQYLALIRLDAFKQTLCASMHSRAWFQRNSETVNASSGNQHRSMNVNSCFEVLNDLDYCSIAGEKSTVSTGFSWCEAGKKRDIKGCYDER